MKCQIEIRARRKAVWPLWIPARAFAKIIAASGPANRAFPAITKIERQRRSNSERLRENHGHIIAVRLVAVLCLPRLVKSQGIVVRILYGVEPQIGIQI